jgi:TatD DNase family protein
VLSVTTTPSAWAQTNQLALNSNRIKTALGLHPRLAKEREFELPIFEKLLGLTRYVGEIGLDGTTECLPFFNTQRKVFNHILHLCENAGGKIISIHSRSAVREVLECLQKFPRAGVPILHWFSGTIQELTRASELECFFSINPVMARSTKGRSIIAAIPRNKVLLESDGPFTTLNDKILYPWNTDLLIPALCEIWQMHEADVRSKIMENFKLLLATLPEKL